MGPDRMIAPLRWTRGRAGRSGNTNERYRRIFVMLRPVNRVLAILGDKVFMGTLDSQ